MATAITLGQLQKVELLRNAWPDEARDFTPWLARSEHIKLLGDAINLDLEVEGQEQCVGRFSADILCKDTATGNWVLVENQLERTNHRHLGQLLTYAAGLDAVTIVWIAARFTDEHRAALDWLNKATREGIDFFGLEVELWQIGDSEIAPKLNVVSSPNDWTDRVKTAKETAFLPLTPAKKLQLDFWLSFREYLNTQGSSFRPSKPYAQNFMPIAIGRDGFHLSAVACKSELRVQLVMNDSNAKCYFAQLLALKSEIECELGEPLSWYNPDDNRELRLFLRTSADLDDRAQWPNYHEWLRTKLDALRRIFAERVKLLEVETPLQEDAEPLALSS